MYRKHGVVLLAVDLPIHHSLAAGREELVLFSVGSRVHPSGLLYCACRVFLRLVRIFVGQPAVVLLLVSFQIFSVYVVVSFTLCNCCTPGVSKYHALFVLVSKAQA